MNVCNSCGSPYEVQICPIPKCFTLICSKCRTNHTSACEFNQKKKSLGLGPTIRQVNIIEVNRSNPLEPANQKIVFDGPAAVKSTPVETVVNTLHEDVVKFLTDPLGVLDGLQQGEMIQSSVAVGEATAVSSAQEALDETHRNMATVFQNPTVIEQLADQGLEPAAIDKEIYNYAVDTLEAEILKHVAELGLTAPLVGESQSSEDAGSSPVQS